ncbi:MAG TPA: hypothetical protein VJ975_00605 [Candidatus Limnocylindria bacterium]|nr:hypothetical protein [Candidatus Limnocylindria bacterium]
MDSSRTVLPKRGHDECTEHAMTIQPPPNDETPPPVPETDPPPPIDTPDEPMPEQRAPGVNEPPMGAPRDEPDLELS